MSGTSFTSSFSSFSTSLSSSLLIAVGTLDTLELEPLEAGWSEPE